MRHLLIAAFLAAVIGLRHGARNFEADRRNLKKSTRSYSRHNPTLRYYIPASEVKLGEVKRHRSRFWFDLRRMIAAAKSNSNKHHLIAPPNRIEKKETSDNDDSYIFDLFDPILRRSDPYINFDELSIDQKNEAINKYSYGLRTLGKYRTSSKLYSWLMMELPSWPRNFILTVLRHDETGAELDCFFFYYDPKSENDIKMMLKSPVTYDPTATIDVGIHNPKYVRIYIRNEHADSIVGDNVEYRVADGNCFFHAALGAMTPEMRAEFFANAKHEYNEDNYSALTESGGCASIKESVHASVEPGVPSKGINNSVNVGKNCFKKLQGVKEDVQFIRNEFDKAFKKNAGKYIEWFGLPDA